MTKAEKLSVGAIFVGFIAVGYSWYSRRKVKEMYDLIEDTVDKMSRTIDINAPQVIVEAAIDKAVGREVNDIVQSLSRETISRVRADLQKEVKESVVKSYSNIRASVSEEVKKQVSYIDISDLKQEIKDEAKEKVISKFDGDLDSLLDDFNQNLKNVSKIYNSIAGSMTHKPEQIYKIV